MTVNVVVAVLVFPAASVAVSVIVCVPTPTTVPAAGLCMTLTGPQLSLAMAADATLGISACPLLSACTVVGAGAVNIGAVLSITVTVCVADALFPDASVAVYVIVVTPTGKMFPAGTPERVIVALPELSLAVATPSALSLTKPLQLLAPGPVIAVTAAGAVTAGATVSLTVI